MAQLADDTSHLLRPSQAGYALAVSYAYNESEAKGRFVVTQSGVELRWEEFPFLPHLFPITVYMDPAVHFLSQMVVDWFGKAEVEGKKAQVVETLRLLDNEIEDLFTVTQEGRGFVYARRTSGRSLPLNAMGSGINKLLGYVLAMTADPGCFLLVDEIETGLHYRFYPKLWELIADVARKTGCQVMATTHSDECIRAAVEGTSRVDPSLLTYIRLGREGEAIVPYRFAGEELAYALEREMELR